MSIDIASITLPEILLWLLTYAVVYGVLSQAGIPQSKAARSIIALVAGFFVLMSNPLSVLAVLSQVTSDMLLVIIALLSFLVFVEMMGVKIGGQKPHEHSSVAKIIFLALIVIATAIFVSAGGLELLGWRSAGIFNISWNTLFFIIVIVGAIWWMISEGGGGGKNG